MKDKTVQKINEILKCIGFEMHYEEKLMEVFIEVDRLAKKEVFDDIEKELIMEMESLIIKLLSVLKTDILLPILNQRRRLK